MAVRRAVLAALCGLLVAGCGSTGPHTAVPRFPVPSAADTPGADPVRDVGAIPDDCARILSTADLGAVLGLPLDSVAVRTTQGVPAPAVGRTERVACRYTANGSSQALLDVNTSVYTDGAAAENQWRTNAAIEDGARRDLMIGAARAVLFERGREALLTVVHQNANISIILPTRPLPPGLSREGLLVDIALRVLPTVAAGEAPQPPPTTADRSQAAGA